MKYYIELTLLADSEITLYFLWQKLYQQIHLAFVEVKNSDNKINVGVSFPEYKQKQGGLGTKLRIFGQRKQDLEALKLEKWLDRLSDYIHQKKIKDVPKKTKGYAIFKRIHEKGNIEKLARHRVVHLEKKGIKISYQKALEFFQSSDRPQSQLDIEKLPFINMQSLSTAQKHSLFIGYEKAELNDSVVFSTYGLSSEKNKSVVPLF